MSKLYDQLSSELIDILRGFGKVLTLYDVSGNRTYEHTKARRVFCQPDNMMVTFDEDGENSEIQVSISNTTDLKDIEKLLSTLRSTTTRYNVLFSVKKYGKVLTPVDFAYKDIPVSEAINPNLNTGYSIDGLEDVVTTSSPFYNVSMEVICPFSVDVLSDDGISSWVAEPGDVIDDMGYGVFIISRDGFSAQIADTEASTASEKIEKMIAKSFVAGDCQVPVEGESQDMPVQSHIMVSFEYDGDSKIARDLIQQFDNLELYSNTVSNGIRDMIFIIPDDNFLTIDDYIDEFEVVLASYDKEAEITGMTNAVPQTSEVLDESVEEGDMVATHYGPATVRKVSGDNVRVELQNGKITTVHIDDIEKALTESKVTSKNAIQKVVDSFEPEDFSREYLYEIVGARKKDGKRFPIEYSTLKHDVIAYVVQKAEEITDETVSEHEVEDRLEEVMPYVIDYLQGKHNVEVVEEATVTPEKTIKKNVQKSFRDECSS